MVGAIKLARALLERHSRVASRLSGSAAVTCNDKKRPNVSPRTPRVHPSDGRRPTRIQISNYGYGLRIHGAKFPLTKANRIHFNEEHEITKRYRNENLKSFPKAKMTMADEDTG